MPILASQPSTASKPLIYASTLKAVYALG